MTPEPRDPTPTEGVRAARFEELPPTTAYAVWRLRAEIFVVEQDCVYLDLDGRDTEPGTEHWWIAGEADDGPDTPVATYLRVLVTDHPDTRVIGRVVTAPTHRGRGLAARLMRACLADLDGRGVRTVEIGAQAHLAAWYAGFGYERAGGDYLEDGIPHTPMRRVTSRVGPREA